MHLACFFRIRTGFAFLLFPCLLAWASGHTQPISRYALLVGIGPYAPESGWSRLHADEDARKWQALFLKNGFLPANCKTLLNKEATYTNIQIELKTLASHAEPGDQVVVYLGGHARKIQDHSGDERDGWDEAFVPYDVPARWGTGAEEMPPYLCDDELGKWLGKIADKVTRMGSLLVVFDAGISEGKNLPVHSKGPLLPFRFPNPGQDKQPNPTPHDNEWLDVSFTEERSQMITLDEGPDAGCTVHEVPYGPAGKPPAWGSRLTQTFVAAVSKNPGIRFRELSANPLSKPAGGGGCPIRIDGAIQLPVFKPNPEGQASPTTEAQAETNSGSVFLFTIGVSRYQNVDPLNFAHADAGLFHGLIQSVYPGGIPVENQFLFLDSLATIKPIIDGLESINNRLKAGDKVYFYFAGHGDVENLLSRKAHLLLYNSPANVYKAGGTLPVEDIKDYFQQWIYKKARVFLVVDACRSGKLAGGFEGRDAALASLQEVNTQSARLLSCQPNEKSEESSIFGGGHGAFTYFLVKGLSGAANQNGDQKITIDEIGRFLQDSVARATESRQNPTVTGNRQLALFSGLAPAQIPAYSPPLAKTRTEDQSNDSLRTRWHKELSDHLARQRILEPKGKCARDAYSLLANTFPLEGPFLEQIRLEIQNTLDRKSQGLINEYVAGNDKLVREELFSLAAREMEFLLNLMDVRSPLYFTYLSRKYFFEGRSISPMRAGNPANRNRVLTALRNLQTALKYEPEGAHIVNAVGLLHFANRNFESAIPSFRKAIALSPNWKFARNNLATAFFEKSRTSGQMALLDSAIRLYQYCLGLDPAFPNALTNLGKAWVEKGKPQLAKGLYKTCMFRNPEYWESYHLLGDLYRTEQKWDSARFIFRIGLGVDPRNADLETNLGNTWFDESQTNPEQKNHCLERAAGHFQQALSLQADNENALGGMGNVCWEKGRFDSSAFYFGKCLELDSANVLYRNYFTEALYKKGALREARIFLHKTLSLFPEDAYSWFESGVLSILEKNDKKARMDFEKAIRLGLTDSQVFEMEDVLADFRKTRTWEILKSRLKKP